MTNHLSVPMPPFALMGLTSGGPRVAGRLPYRARRGWTLFRDPRRCLLRDRPTGIPVAVRRSKTDQDGQGQFVGVARGQHRETDPIRALDLWLKIRPAGRGGLSTCVYRSGTATTERIAAQTRHRDLATLLNHYIRPAEALATTTSRVLGL